MVAAVAAGVANVNELEESGGHSREGAAGRVGRSAEEPIVSTVSERSRLGDGSIGEIDDFAHELSKINLLQMGTKRGEGREGARACHG